MMVTASLIYWLMSIVLELIQKRIETHFNRRQRDETLGNAIAETAAPAIEIRG